MSKDSKNGTRSQSDNGRQADPSAKPAERDADSSELLLDDMKRSFRDSGDDPSTPDKIRLAQIAAWDRMSECMIANARQIKAGDERGTRREGRIRKLVLSVWLAVPIVILTSIYTAAQSRDLMNELAARTYRTLVDMSHRQDATLAAVNALNEAMAATIQAQADPSVESEQHAADTAVAAQKKAIEAQKKLAKSPAERREADVKLEQVDKKVEELKQLSPEQLHDSLRPPPPDDE